MAFEVDGHLRCSLRFLRRLGFGLTVLALVFLQAVPVQADILKKAVLSIDGRPRYFLMHIPVGLENPPAPVPAVIIFHGGGGSALQAERSSMMSQLADEKKFIAVYPEGSRAGLFGGQAWNAGKCCGNPMKHNIDDVKFVDRIIDELRFRYHVDPERTFATGISNGAQMAYRAGCELSDKIAAIAPIAGQRVNPPCKPKRPLSVLHFHGTDDPCTLYEGGTCGGCLASFLGFGRSGAHWECPAVADDISAFAKDNHCPGPARSVFQKGEVRCESYGTCPSEGEVVLCTVHGGGHTWPGGSNGTTFCARRPNGRLCKRFKEVVGHQTSDVSATQMMWEFFSKHPR